MIANRSFFLIDPQGIIRKKWIIENPATTVRIVGHTDSIEVTAQRIKAAGRGLAVPPGARVIDLSSRFRLDPEVPLIFGEYHGKPGPEGVQRLLGKTHEVTIEHVQHAFYMAANYGFQILNGNFAAAIDDYELSLRFMNDLATYRIDVSWLWSLLHHQAAITKELIEIISGAEAL